MLDLARQLNPDCTYHAGDMRTIRLDETFDAVFIADFKILQQQTGDQGIIHFICLKPSQAN
jgi:trans-aconitate methyltransferase